MGTPSWQMMFTVGGATFVTLGALLLLGLWYQRHLGITPGGAVESVPRPGPDALTVRMPAPIVLSSEKIMSWERDRRIVIGAHRLRLSRIRRSDLAQNAKLKAENERLKSENAKLRQFSDGQRTGVREFLERERAKKPVTRATVTKLLGRDTSKGYVLIAEEMEKLEPEAETIVGAKLNLEHSKA